MSDSKPTVHLLNDLRHGSVEFERLKSGLLTLWRSCAWAGPMSPLPGLAFPPGPDSIERIRSEGKTVKVYALDSEGVVVGGLILHLGSSISDYAAEVRQVLQAAGSEEQAFIRSLVVLPSERGKKYGSLLLTKALAEAKRFGATGVGAHAMSQPVRNEWIRRAYKNAGFISARATATYTVKVPKRGDWEAQNREEVMPQEIEVEYEGFIAPVSGFELRRARGGSFTLTE